MPEQEDGLIGRMVGAMVRRAVRTHFRGLYWIPPAEPIRPPAIFACNHHGWYDGHVMFHVVTRLGLPGLLWIEELGAFPLFAKAGAMPFPKGDAAARGATVRRTIRRMTAEGRSLVLFPEGVLHRPPEVLPFGRALEFVAENVDGVSVIPVAIHYELSLHERPEAFVALGPPIEMGADLCGRARLAVEGTLVALREAIKDDPDSLEPLAKGTKDVNERWDMRRIPGSRRQ